jgi:hypothetical protein
MGDLVRSFGACHTAVEIRDSHPFAGTGFWSCVSGHAFLARSVSGKAASDLNVCHLNEPCHGRAGSHDEGKIAPVESFAYRYEKMAVALVGRMFDSTRAQNETARHARAWYL